jgi:hypothetical protein
MPARTGAPPCRIDRGDHLRISLVAVLQQANRVVVLGRAQRYSVSGALESRQVIVSHRHGRMPPV